MNVVTLIGNVAGGVKLLKVGAGGEQVARLLLSVDRPGGGDFDLVDVEVRGAQAATCKRSLHVGQRLAVDGRIRTSGPKLEEVVVVANHLHFLSEPTVLS